MTEPMLGGYVCVLHQTHSPFPLNHNVHHVLPKSWGGPDVPENEVVLCPTGHENVHTVLNWLVRYGSWSSIPTNLRQHISYMTANLAMQAWNMRPDDHPPYTVTKGVS